MDRSPLYAAVKEAISSLNHKLQQGLTKGNYFEAARVLGMLDRNGSIEFNHDEAPKALTELAIHTSVSGEFRSTAAKSLKLNEYEQKVLEAYPSSFTSLFRIESLSIENGTATLHDLLHPERPDFEIMDLQLSRFLTQGLMTFTRILTVDDLAVSAGPDFMFGANLSEFLVQRYKKLAKKTSHTDHEVQIFAAFNELYRTEGARIVYKS